MPIFDQEAANQKSAKQAGRSLVVRWRILAQQRMDHLIELYQTGRWKRYHKEQDFLEMVQEARTALKMWEQLAPYDAVLDKTVEVALAQDISQIEAESQSGEPAPITLDALLDGIVAEHDSRKS
jgi:uncharacterized repeat protein (TIGR03809 family)